MAYTYLIGWSNLEKYYYGARGTDVDLWTEYFTSSETVKEYRETYGEPDIIQVRREFSTADEAFQWESKVLIRLNAAKNDKWLNKSNGYGGWYNTGHTDETKQRLSEMARNITDETRKKMSEAAKKRVARDRESHLERCSLGGQKHKGKVTSEETKRKLREASKKAWANGKFNERKPRTSRSKAS